MRAGAATLVGALLVGLVAAPATALLSSTDDVVAALLSPTPANEWEPYHDPLYLGWSAWLPSVPGDFEASTEQDCPPGSIHCVDNAIREMTRRYERLGCDHNAVFAMTYLLTTEQYRDAVTQDGFFTDPAFINHQDAVFADYYFDAIDQWRKGNVDEVPPAWRVALHAADNREVHGMGDILLGMNAHIRRDLPFVLAAIGLTKPDGTSRKPDHDQVNVFLNEVYPKIMEEAARRHDPTIGYGDVPGVTIERAAVIQVIQEWREEAWRKAEMLTNAETDAERAQVAEMIEADAAMAAKMIRDSFRYDGVVFTPDQRAAHCQAWLDSQ